MDGAAVGTHPGEGAIVLRLPVSFAHQPGQLNVMSTAPSSSTGPVTGMRLGVHS